MKERAMNVLAWGTWAVALVFFLQPLWSFYEGGFQPSAYVYDANRWLDDTSIGLIFLAVQWVLYYIITGSPRFLPWHYQSKMALQPVTTADGATYLARKEP